MAVSFGSGLELVSFQFQKQSSSGGWSLAHVLRKNSRYRFRLKLKNVVDTKKRSNKNHSYLEPIYVHLVNAGYASFYSSSSYTGTPTDYGLETEYIRIKPGKTHVYYFYFIWKSPSDIPMPPPGIEIWIELCDAQYKGKKHKTLPPLIPE